MLGSVVEVMYGEISSREGTVAVETSFSVF
jgi:hypothetical protein